MGNHHEDNYRLNHPDFRSLDQGLDRRNFLQKTAMGLGAAALQVLMGGQSLQAKSIQDQILESLPKIAPKAKRVVYLFMSGGPSQFETFDYKPNLKKPQRRQRVGYPRACQK